MRYIIIIILALSLPATALVSPFTQNTSNQQTLKNKEKTEELRKIIQSHTGSELCDPEQELRMPTFY